MEPAAFAAALARLDADRQELETRSQAALARAREEFAVETKARAYAEFFARWRELKRPASAPPRRHGSRLDVPWIPNGLVVGLRRFRRWRRGVR